QHPEMVMVRINGPLDTVASYEFHEKMESLVQNGVYKFIVNLEKLDYISSAGIGVFPGMSLELQKNQGGIVFIHVPPKTYKLFDMIGLTTIFRIKNTLEEAIKELSLHES
ncbi:MAG: STAS domain-containing protein, partial [Candidatus Vecturithrix sp.]|nr:STAS domain-containing protein [Candidatus Vecturithrix sp.]